MLDTVESNMSDLSSTTTTTSLASTLSGDSTKHLVEEMDLIKQLQFEDTSPYMPTTEQIEANPMQRDTQRGNWPRKQIIKLFLIGILMTLTTNLPSAFTHTSINTAYYQVNVYLNESYTSRGMILKEENLVWLRSLISASWYAGQIFGAQFSPFITDRLGRKPAYLIATFMMTLACVLQSASTLFPYPELLIFGRVLASLFSPLSDAAAILYLQEISPTHIRGMLSSLFTTTYSIMGLLGMILGTRSVLGHSLTLLLAVPIMPGILSLLMLLYLPETPKFLFIVRHAETKAKKSLQFYQGNRVDNQQTLNSYAEEGLETDGSIFDLFKEKYLQSALLCTIMCTVPTLAFYPILQSSTYLLKKMQFEGSVPEYSSASMMIVLIISCILAAEALNRFSRRNLFIFCSIGATVSLALFSITGAMLTTHWTMKYLSLVGLFGYVIFYGLGLGPISFFIGTELVPLTYRSSIFSVSFSINNIIIVATSICVQPAYEKIGSWCFLLLFVLPNIFAIMYVNAKLPETKGCETHQIVENLKRKTGFFRRNIKGVTNSSFKAKSDAYINSPFTIQLV